MTTSITNYADAHDLDASAAIEQAARRGHVLNTYSDPTEEGRDGCSVEHAQAVPAEDPSLVYIGAACAPCGAHGIDTPATTEEHPVVVDERDGNAAPVACCDECAAVARAYPLISR